MTEGEFDPSANARARDLLDRFLFDRNDRTLQAYTTDLDDFARFLDMTVCEVLQACGSLSEEEARELIQEAQVEWEDGRMAYPVATAFGQKPHGSRIAPLPLPAAIVSTGD